MNASRHESSPSSGGFGFQDTLERSLQQVGVGGRAGLQQYWHTEVLENARLLEMEAEEYRNAYLTRTVSCGGGGGGGGWYVCVCVDD